MAVAAEAEGRVVAAAMGRFLEGAVVERLNRAVGLEGETNLRSGRWEVLAAAAAAAAGGGRREERR